MARKTVSLTEDLESRIAEFAQARGLSFSAAVALLLERQFSTDRLPYEASGEGPPDLALNAERYLDRLAAENER